MASPSPKPKKYRKMKVCHPYCNCRDWPRKNGGKLRMGCIWLLTQGSKLGIIDVHSLQEGVNDYLSLVCNGSVIIIVVDGCIFTKPKKYEKEDAPSILRLMSLAIVRLLLGSWAPLFISMERYRHPLITDCLPLVSPILHNGINGAKCRERWSV